MDLQLTNKTAIVLGGSQGLGFATAQTLAAEGARVMIVSRTQANIDDAINQIKQSHPTAQVQGFAADVTDPNAIQALMQTTVATFGGIDIVITNSSGPKSGTFSQLAMSELQSAFELLVQSAANVIHAALPHLRKSQAAAILTITSITTKQPDMNLALSNIFRPAVIGLTKSLAAELGTENIRVNSILPGWTSTNRTESLLTNWSGQHNTTPEQEREQITRNIPLGRFGDPKEFGNVAAFLVSPMASYVTGLMMQVDGGMYKGLI